MSADQRRIARRSDQGAVLHGDRVHAVNRLDNVAAAHGYPDRLDAMETKAPTQAASGVTRTS